MGGTVIKACIVVNQPDKMQRMCIPSEEGGLGIQRLISCRILKVCSVRK